MTSLANLSALGVRLGLDLTGDTRAQGALDDASANVRGYCGRDFADHVDDTLTVPVRGGVATLPVGPVRDVSSVTSDGQDVAFTWVSGRKILGLSCELRTVEVVATWGYEAVPDDVVAVVLQVAGRAYGTKPQDSGTTTVTLGDYSEGTGGAAASGALGMLPAEREVLDRYRVGTKPGTISVGLWAW